MYKDSPSKTANILKTIYYIYIYLCDDILVDNMDLVDTDKDKGMDKDKDMDMDKVLDMDEGMAPDKA